MADNLQRRDEMSDAGKKTDDVPSATKSLENVDLSDPQPSTLSKDEAVPDEVTRIHIEGEGDSSKFDGLVQKFMNGCKQRNARNVWIIRLPRSRDGKTNHVFAAGESEGDGEVEDYFMAWWDNNATNYDTTWLKVYANSTPNIDNAHSLANWLNSKQEEKKTYLSIHFAFLSESWEDDNPTGKGDNSSKIDTTIKCSYLALNRIDNVTIGDLVGDLLIKPPKTIKPIEDRIIYKPKILLKGESGFKELVTSFCNACQDPRTHATYWIIELKQFSTSESKGVFAAAENEGSGNDHVEIVFMKWWNSYGNSTYKSVTVFTNYAPCQNCATELHKWLANNPSAPRLLIRYAFVYVDYKNIRHNWKNHAKDSTKELIHMVELNILDLEKIGTDSLTRLAKDVHFQNVTYTYPEYTIPEYPKSYMLANYLEIGNCSHTKDLSILFTRTELSSKHYAAVLDESTNSFPMISFSQYLKAELTKAHNCTG